MFKILDKYLIKAFIPPFIVFFGIALFVLVMQMLWLYIDDIMGKGVGFFTLVELVFYMSISLVPMAIPLGVLVASVMVMGGFAENYELASCKSAGIGLVRITRPLFFAVCGISIFSIFVSEKVIPWSNLKFYSRFYDIRKTRPTLTFQDGVFNDEFDSHTMRIGKKKPDGRSLEDVLIYSKRQNDGKINQMISKNGEMFTTADKQFIVMNLFDGTQYQETTQANGSSEQKSKNPFVRIKFKSWQKVFDLTQFDRRKTDEEAFGSHPKMKPSWALKNSADSMKRLITTQRNDFNDRMRSNYQIYKKKYQSPGDTATQHVVPPPPQYEGKKILDKIDSINRSKREGTPVLVKKDTLTKVYIAKTDTQSQKNLPQNFYDLKEKVPIYEYQQIGTTAISKVRELESEGQSQVSTMRHSTIVRGKFIYEMHMKYNMAAICIVFLFIGAPMGAIVQKGGFGMPILVAIFFFMLYIILNTFGKNQKDVDKMDYVLAAWLSVFTLIPIAAILTYRAMNDYKMVNFDPAKAFIKLKDYILNLLPKKKEAV